MPDRDTRGTMSFRAWGRTKERLEELGKAEKFAHTTLIGDTAEILAEWITCSRCGEEIPAIMGDCTGKPLRLWVADATAAVYRQKCKDHKPVLVGAQAASQSPVSTGTAEPAATGAGDAGERTEPTATAPAKGRKVPQQRRVPPSVVAAEKKTAALASLRDIPGIVRASDLAPAATSVPFMAGPDVDCLHENFRGVKGVCPDCKQWVGGKR